MEPRLVARNEARPQRDALRPEAKRAGEARSVPDAARGERGYRVDRLEGRRHEIPYRCRPLHVPARLDSLRDHRVDAGLGRRFRLLHRADLDEHVGSAPVRDLDVRRRVAPEEHDRRHPLVRRRGDLVAQQLLVLLGEIGAVLPNNEVDAKRLFCQLTGASDQPTDLLGLHATDAENAKPSCI